MKIYLSNYNSYIKKVVQEQKRIQVNLKRNTKNIFLNQIYKYNLENEISYGELSIFLKDTVNAVPLLVFLLVCAMHVKPGHLLQN